MNHLSDFLNVVSNGKQQSKTLATEKKIKEESLLSFLETFVMTNDAVVEEVVSDIIIEEVVPDIIIEEVVPDIIIEEDSTDPLLDPRKYDKLFKTNVDLFTQPKNPKVAPELKAITDKLQYVENWITKISFAGPGGGEVNLRWLDDVYRPSIYDGRFLRYNDTLKKFEFAEVNPHDIVFSTLLIDTPTYLVDGDEYYMGVNYAGPVTITLPTTPSSGRMLIIKDESGHASTNHITVLGTVDNDTGGFIIQLDNGGIQMIYRNGWRIV
jgi:hypothetical protein